MKGGKQMKRQRILKRFAMFIICCFVVMACAAIGVSSEETEFTGTVRNEDGAGIAGATVYIWDYDDVLVGTAKTDLNGEYIMSAEEGNYIIGAACNGSNGLPYSWVDYCTVSGGSATNSDFTINVNLEQGLLLYGNIGQIDGLDFNIVDGDCRIMVGDYIGSDLWSLTNNNGNFIISGVPEGDGCYLQLDSGGTVAQFNIAVELLEGSKNEGYMQLKAADTYETGAEDDEYDEYEESNISLSDGDGVDVPNVGKASGASGTALIGLYIGIGLLCIVLLAFFFIYLHRNKKKQGKK